MNEWMDGEEDEDDDIGSRCLACKWFDMRFG